MNFFAIMLNPSQSVFLKRNAEKSLRANGERAFWVSPLLCPIDCGEEEAERVLGRIREMVVYGLSATVRGAAGRGESIQQPKGVRGEGGVLKTEGVRGEAGVLKTESVRDEGGVPQMRGVWFFPCRIDCGDEHDERLGKTAFFCGVGNEYLENKRFCLEDFFALTKDTAKNLDEGFWSDGNFLFRATSFKLVRVIVEGNKWQIFDVAWRKV